MDDIATRSSGSLKLRWKKLLQHEFISMRMLGFSLLMMWNYLFFFSKHPFLVSAGEGEAVSMYIFLLSSMAYALASLLLVSRQRSVGRFATRHLSRLAMIAGVIVGAGSCMAAFAAPSTVGNGALIASGALTGGGSALATVLWGASYAKAKGATMAVEVSLAFFLAALIVPVSYPMPPAVGLAAVVVLPIASMTVLPREAVMIGLDQNAEKMSGQPNAQPSPYPVRSKRLLVKICCMSLIFGLCNTLMPTMLNLRNTDALYSLIMPGATLVAFLVFVALVLFSRHYGFAFAYKPALFLMVTGYLLSIPLEGTILVSGFSVASYTCFNILNWLLLADACERFRISPIVSFSWGRSALVVGGLLGIAFNAAVMTLLPDVHISYSAAAVGCTLLLLLGYLCVLTERNVDELSLRAPAFNPRLSEEEQAMLARHRKTVEACNLLATRYDLGERARDVLVCLAQGHTAADIEDELYMARGTVNTHTNRIYKKLGVHKRKELLSLIEASSRESSV